MNSPHSQSQYQVRFDWGAEGANTVAADADVIVVVDVLSFSTTVDLAVALGVEVFPCAPDAAEETSARHDAVLAGARGTGFSLSPASITSEALGQAKRIALPSPNGSRIAAGLATHPAAVVAGSLRNAAAIARWALERQSDKGDRFTVAVIASGEVRDDASTRFALEDLLASGAIIDALATVGIDYCSPESAAAAAAFTGLRNATGALISASASGRELAERGFAADLKLAIDLDASTTVPVLREFSFRA